MVDNFVLVAPRPMRIDSFSHRAPFSPSTRLLSPPIDPFSRAIRTDAEQTIEDETTPSSGRNTASPRLNLSSDALEEFLSILRPSLLSPSTPGIRARRNESVSSLLPIERPQTTRFHDGIRNKSPSFSSIASAADDENGLSLVTGFSPRSDSRSDMDTNEQLICNLWRIPGVLESPVSRTHTRNPFQRHPSYEKSFSGTINVRLSPCLLPLPPSPSPVPLNLSAPEATISDENQF
ncbi:hypothetical protein PNOK_0067400 [Pyrrhoderma noxium]|uniref:Uncharacterized protein n=1 Tax=Pyrrhoderma noxium TaxID=2282107 RepID=A0A286UVI5_9AGAM|nr:hypothetical protein PNOK_0067400 [Pyrrhoderma noxium]